ncbi:MAG: helix-turn-helix domain-containing protein [Verrucomicrobia bacterium]|nr:helix-turn-helix domain-containing protein [Verrucomicrobiota bacterium]
MPTVAEQLREGREAQNLTVYQVAEITKIRTDHVRALEEGNFQVFSATVYIRGFVRSYAAVLKLDVPQIMAALDEELSQTEQFSEPPPLSDQPRTAVDFIMLQFSKVNRRTALIALGVALALISLIVIALWWRHYRNADPLAGLTPGLYQPTQNVSGELLPLPPAPPRR